MPAFEQNILQQQANEQAFDSMAMMAVAAMAAKMTLKIGGRVVEYVMDNATKKLRPIVPEEFAHDEELAEAYMNSLHPIPVGHLTLLNDNWPANWPTTSTGRTNRTTSSNNSSSTG